MTTDRLLKDNKQSCSPYKMSLALSVLEDNNLGLGLESQSLGLGLEKKSWSWSKSLASSFSLNVID